ncbi:MAG: hypothetical protein PHS80_15480 [Methanothrix sp.]|nr:hypothetical protein [Methanothrix sp.]
MRKTEYNWQLTLKLSKEQRGTIEKMATNNETSLAWAARSLIDIGIAHST